ncbi:CopG family ribbon-helix-helix protein [Alkalimarinus coralli]|uniref:CopG family ribbon-helix-helix protein n=1 Tax=Alkalimarinus coralli TaxID=2935863 RepID=UPI00202B6914|nr:ribbon-helix-helix protein, CopG family [Alkalimarinus coralli]
MGVTSVRLNSEVEAPLENLANKLDRSKNYIINQAVKEYIQRQSMEDSRWEDTLEALNSVKAGRTVDGAEAASWLESWGTENELSPPKV